MVNLCITIAVSKPEGLDRLPGALAAATDIEHWARRLGYRTHRIADDTPAAGGGNDVTVERLCEEILPLLSSPEEELDRVIVAFAGHGLWRGVAEDYWLLSNWKSGVSQAVNVERFKLRLKTYQPKQVMIVSDACRTLPVYAALDLKGSEVLPKAQFRGRNIEYDLVFATEPGEAANHAPRTEATPYCVLSHVLINALWARYPEAVEKDRSAVVSDFLMQAVRIYVPKVAGQWNAEQFADVAAGFTRPNDVYATLDQLKDPPPRRDPPDPLWPPPPPLPMTPIVWETMLYKLDRPLPLTRTAVILRLEELYDRDERETDLRTAACVLDSGYSRVVTRGDSASGFAPPGAWFDLAQRAQGPLLIQTSDGRWVGSAVYWERLTSFLLGPAGAEKVSYRPGDAILPADAAAASRRALVRLNAGTLTSLEALDLAAALRWRKHSDPVMGALAAYLYVRCEDRDSIRRLAWFYAQDSQPAPFDVVMLADVEMFHGDDGRLLAKIPAVAARAPLAPTEAHELSRETDDCVVEVGGAFPWLRQGWAHLEDSEWRWAKELLHLGEGLQPAPFTTLSRGAGEALADLIQSGRI